jgi:hypothetical protein
MAWVATQVAKAKSSKHGLEGDDGVASRRSEAVLANVC